AHMLLTGDRVAGRLASALPAAPRGTGQVTAQKRAERAATPGPALWKDSRLSLIGCIVLAMALAEGTANDWLPLVMVDGHGLDATLGSAVYAIFAASMTVGRFAG